MVRLYHRSTRRENDKKQLKRRCFTAGSLLLLHFMILFWFMLSPSLKVFSATNSLHLLLGESTLYHSFAFREEATALYKKINDRTLHLSTNQRGNDNLAATNTAYKLLLTNYQWNHPNVTHGLQYARSTRQRELLQAVVNHPNFNSSINWTSVANKQYELDYDMRYYIFLDVETCFESNYPIYAGETGFEENADRVGGRAVYSKLLAECYNLDYCPYVSLVLDVIHEFPKATLVIPECRGNGLPLNYRNTTQPSKQLSVLSLSSDQSQLLDYVDQGLPPPAVTKLHLTSQQIADIYSCNVKQRPYLLSFIGNTKFSSKNKRHTRARRQLVRKLSYEPDMFLYDRLDYFEQFEKTSVSFMDDIVQSQFSAVPRGDNLFSYRFTEVLSAGAIPIILADGWVLPFSERLVSWESCAVMVPEDQVFQLPFILRAMSVEEQCQRRKTCYDIYRKYMATTEGTIQGILDGLELTYDMRHAPPSL